MKVLVTGGAGFIGSNYVRRILDGTLSGVSKIGVLDKLTYAGNLSNLKEIAEGDCEIIVGDICDTNLTNRLLKNYDAVVNFAAETHVDRSISDPDAFIRTNIYGTYNLLNSALKNNIQKYIQISTDEVYGSIEKGSWDEQATIAPNSPYSASKASADLIALSYNKTYGFDVRITRCCNNYGPYQHPEKAIPLFITNQIENKNIPIYGLGKNVREWIHVDDHCLGIHEVLQQGKPGQVYNIAGSHSMQNIELAKKILKIMGNEIFAIDYVTDRKGHDQRYSLSGTRMLNELRFKPKIAFDTGLEQTVEWYKQNKKWWEPLKKE